MIVTSRNAGVHPKMHLACRPDDRSGESRR